jgi:hypothetical protein
LIEIKGARVTFGQKVASLAADKPSLARLRYMSQTGDAK